MPTLNPRSALARNRRPRPLGDGPAGRVYGFGRFMGLRGYPYSFTPGSIGPDQLARDAMAILDALPAGSGVNPIGRTTTYPYPYIVPEHTIHIDTGYMGIAYDQVQPAAPDYAYYETHPVVDASGLIYWTGPDTAIPAPNLTQAQMLAYQVILAGGDTSWSADFYPRSTLQTGGVYSPMQYDPGTSAYTAQQAGSTGTGTAVPVITTQPTTTTLPTAPTSPTSPTGPQPYVPLPSGGPSSGGSLNVLPADAGAGGFTIEDDSGGGGGGGPLTGGGGGGGGGGIGDALGAVPGWAWLAGALAIAVAASSRKRR